MGARWTAYVVLALLAGTVGTMLLGPMRVEAVAREILELQQRVNQLIQSQKDIQTTLTQNGAVDKTLMVQSLDTVKRLDTPLMALQERVQDIHANSLLRLDTMQTPIQGSSDNLREALARTEKLSQQLTEMQNAVRRIDERLSEGAPASVPVRRTFSPRIRANH